MTPLSQDTKFWRLLAAWRDADPAHRDAAGRAIEEYTEGLIRRGAPAGPAGHEVGSPDRNLCGDPVHTLEWRQRGPYCVTGICACGWTGSATAAHLLRQAHSEHVAKEYTK